MGILVIKDKNSAYLEINHYIFKTEGMRMNKQILVVDDEWNMRNLLRIYLTKAGFYVMEAKNGLEALNIIKYNNFDLILLDLMMPEMDGWEVCAKIREDLSVPIIMLTARTETNDKVHGLNLGADDYLTKPFEPEELIARVSALLRRANVSESSHLQQKNIIFCEMSINPEGRQVLIHQHPVAFTPKEFDLLHLLASHTTRVYSREHLLWEVWGEDYFGEERTVDTHIKSIRGKVKKAGLSYNPIGTVWGVGYKFQRQSIEDEA
jgi:two-component system response regulator ResD